MINRLKKWFSKYLNITIEFNKVDIDTVDYENGYVATAVASDGTKITVYEKEDWGSKDPIFAYSWEKNVGGVITSGSSRVSYYQLKNHRFKVVKLLDFDSWYRDFCNKELKAKEVCRLQSTNEIPSYACIARTIKEGKA